jgi:hypothetical protein
MNGAYDNLQRELLEERAAALARIGGRLQEAIDGLSAIRGRLPDARGDEQGRLIGAYRALRAHAIRYRWYLEVQREVVGFRNHRWIDQLYRIPEPL